MAQNGSFVSRGGLWVLAQVPLMLLAGVIPVYFGNGQLTPVDSLAWFGAWITAAGALLIAWSFVRLGKALTPYPRPLAGARLRQNGPYQFMRHPIYSGVVLASLGWAVWLLSVDGIFCALLLGIFFDRKARREENWLRQQYADYADYAHRVKKFIPGIY
jgi:protein-S-isoprenylcysteine O-methyltransferase Ste14